MFGIFGVQGELGKTVRTRAGKIEGATIDQYAAESFHWFRGEEWRVVDVGAGQHWRSGNEESSCDAVGSVSLGIILPSCLQRFNSTSSEFLRRSWIFQIRNFAFWLKTLMKVNGDFFCPL